MLKLKAQLSSYCLSLKMQPLRSLQSIYSDLGQFFRVRNVPGDIFHKQIVQQNRRSEAMDRHRQSKSGNALYEQVVARNFEVIEHFLSQFHEIFLKQEQFENAMAKMEHRVGLVERNSRKIEEVVNKSSDMYEKKINSLKEFVAEKVKMLSLGEKSSLIPVLFPQQNTTAQSGNLAVIDKEIMARYETQSSMAKKLQENMNEQIKKLEYQLYNTNQKINSLTILTNSLNERAGTSVHAINSFNEERSSVMLKDLENKLTYKMDSLNQRLEKSIRSAQKLYEEEHTGLIQKINNNFDKIQELQASIGLKLSTSDFDQFKDYFKDEQLSLTREIAQNFAKKQQTKRLLNLFEKKILKLQLVEQILKESGETSQQISVVPANLMYRTRPLSIHTAKGSETGLVRTPKLKASDSLQIRRLASAKKKMKQNQP